MAASPPTRVLAARGGSFLIEERSLDEVFTPEDFSEEQRMIGQAAQDFMESEMVPRLPEILSLKYEATRELLRKAGEMGLLGVEIPTEYGGLGLDKVSGCLIAEKAARDGSFAVSFTGHVGIGTLPIVYFGTEEQKRRFLPRLASGEWISSYSLSEASSASDAMNARARAVASADGKSWVLNGEKMWLTNAGFADVYITFAKVDGAHFTAFIIEKGSPGVSLGAEEKKTGIKGSSTRPLILQDAVIPRENLLGEVGKGHKIAFNILNIGRFKLAAGCTGGAKLALRSAVQYGMGRTAFGRPVTDFGLVRHKVGEMALRIYAAESMVYRTAGMIDRSLADVDLRDPGAILKRIEQYDVECSMLKVWCSEMLDYVVDETVQVHGGAGYVEDYPAERYWRDARVNRIFEGTNEINRLLVPGRLVRRAMAGELPVLEAARAVLASAARPSPDEASGFLAAEQVMVRGAKRAALLCLGRAVERLGPRLADEQEVLGHFADVAMETYALESALLRARKKAAAGGTEDAALQEAAVRCLSQDAMDTIEVHARRLLAALEQGDALRADLAALEALTRRETADTVALRRRVAAAALAQGGYPFS
jgi:alkylation response protein AidB-like acyl-CoA dehydrogenase